MVMAAKGGLKVGYADSMVDRDSNVTYYTFDCTARDTKETRKEGISFSLCLCLAVHAYICVIYTVNILYYRRENFSSAFVFLGEDYLVSRSHCSDPVLLSQRM